MIDHARRRQATLYDLLQVNPLASPEVIRAAYRVLARRYHPDCNASLDAAAQMREINAAYHVLSDPNRRARYDARLRRVEGSRGSRLAAAGVPRRAVSARPAAASLGSSGVRGRALLAILAIVAVVSFLIWLLWLAYDSEDALSASDASIAGLVLTWAGQPTLNLP
jgi:curved DNA-binding protein CbpA